MSRDIKARLINSNLYERCPVCHLEERHMVSCLVAKLEERLDIAQEALVCLVCGKPKPFVAICFDCLGDDVDEISKWHREVSVSNTDGSWDECSQCRTPWPCDAIKALKLRDAAIEDAAKKGALAEEPCRHDRHRANEDARTHARAEAQPQQDFDRWQREHLAAGPGKIPACLGLDCPACRLARLKLAEAQEEAL